MGMSKQRVDRLMTEHLIYNLFEILYITLNCLWNSKRYCKDPLDALATMKITQKKQEMRKNIGSQCKDVNVWWCDKPICDLELKIFGHYYVVFGVERGFCKAPIDAPIAF